MIERHFVQQELKKIQLEQWLKSQLERAGFTRVETIKTPLVTRIVIHVTHPGLAIGKGGTNIRRLTEEIEKKFQIDNPQIEINEIEKPELDAQAMVNKIKTLLERGYSWRSVGYRTAKDIMNAGAQGVEIIFSGALAGKGQRKRRQRISEGYMKKVGNEAKLVDTAKAHSYPKFGAIGIKVKIVKPGTIFTDKINIREELEKREKKETELKEEKKETKKVEEKKKKTEKEEKKKVEKKK